MPQGCAWVPGPGEGVFACGRAKSEVPHPSAAMLPALLSVLVGSVLLWDVGTAVAGRGLDPTARLGRRKLRGSAGASSLCFCRQAGAWGQWVLLWSRLAASPVASLADSCRYCR